MSIAFWVSFFVLLVSLAGAVQLAAGIRKVKNLRDIPVALPEPPPKVSIVVSALNEGDTIEPAMRSLLALDYPDLEIIAIDDRSTDATGEVLDRIAREHPALRVLHIRELPEGWLGKNHALQRGAEMASGAYILFTDADVVFEASAISRAVSYCEREGLDHLTVPPHFIVDDEHLLAMMLINGTILFYAAYPPWRLRTSPTKYMGVGAFNMVRAASYRQVGGHVPLALEVVDDLMLGKLMKSRGLRQDALFGFRAVSIRWYRNTAEMIRGLEKNSLAALDYRPGALLVITAAMLLLHLWPWVGLFVAQGATWWCCVGALAFQLLARLDILRPTGWSWKCLLWWPVAPLVSLVALWRAVTLTLRRGGVIWRGTHYPLDALRSARRAFLQSHPR